MSHPERTAGSVPPRSLFTSFLITLALVAIAIMLFSRLGRWFYLAELLGNFQLQMGVLSLLLPLLLWWRGARQTAFATCLVALITLVNPLWSYVPSAPQTILNPQRLRLMAFNLLAANRDQEAIRRSITAADPDVVLLVEYTPFLESLRQELAAVYPHQIVEPRWHGFGIGLLSKFPLRDSQVGFLTLGPLRQETPPPYLVKDDPYLDVGLDVRGQPLRLLGVHFFNPTEYSRYAARNQQFARLAEIVQAHQERPLVVLGDFNCTPWSPYFRRLRESTGLQDSRQGWGFQGSWPAGGDFLSIPIDHILVSKDVSVVGRKVLPEAGSDHYPVLCDLEIPGGPASPSPTSPAQAAPRE